MGTITPKRLGTYLVAEGRAVKVFEKALLSTVVSTQAELDIGLFLIPLPKAK
jgi:hypothetical protein